MKPRNEHQELAFDMLKDSTITVKLITGTWGTGKTMALVVAALEAVGRGEFEKIIWVRNNVQVKDTDQIGALPGEAYDKMLPYLGPFCDHVGGETGVHMLIQNNQLEVIPLGFLRGRNIANSIIICSEAENLTKEHIQLLLGRVAEGSALWLDGDVRQRDRVAFEKSKGLETMIDKLKGEELFGYVHLVKSERSATARLADKLN
jgi:PhoH-like ATPase